MFQSQGAVFKRKFLMLFRAALRFEGEWGFLMMSFLFQFGPVIVIWLLGGLLVHDKSDNPRV